MKLSQYRNWLPSKSSFLESSFFGFLKKFLIFFASLTLVFLSTGLASQVLAQTASTTITINNGQDVVAIVGGQQRFFQIQLNNLSDPDGLAAFGFKLKFDPNLLPVADANGDGKADAGQVTVGSFLGSSGKQVACSDGYIDKDTTDSTKKLLTFSCVTFGSTPAGPTGSGRLVTISFTTGNTLGIGSLSLVSTELVDNTEVANLISHTSSTAIIQIAKCGDYNGDRVVAMVDILADAQKFGLTSSSPNLDPKYDVDGNNAVNIQDILTVAKEYGMRCP